MSAVAGVALVAALWTAAGSGSVDSMDVESMRVVRDGTGAFVLAADVEPQAKRGAAKKPAAKKRKPAPKRPSGPITVPIDVGVGPIALVPTGAAFWDQPVHSGLTLSVAAVVDQALIRRYRDQIPAEWRNAAGNVKEARVRPWFLALIPEVLVISPSWLRTGMYGAIWRPLGLGLTFLDEPVHVSAHASLDLAYVFIHSSAPPPLGPNFTHFLRPGVNLDLTAEVPLTDSVLMSTGWSSSFFPPQPVGRPPWELWPLDGSLWHLGGPFVKLHVRIPYELNF